MESEREYQRAEHFESTVRGSRFRQF
jgi:hypothetical protein